jgi:hypothetical protein
LKRTREKLFLGNKNVISIVFSTLLVSFFVISVLIAPKQAIAQSSSQKEDMRKAASFYLTIRCNEFHRADFIWDPAITVARWQGLQKGDSIPKDLLRAMKAVSKGDEQDGQKLLSYRWPTPDVKAAIDGIANGLLSDSKDVASIASANKWRTPNWSEWWQKDEAMLRQLGLSQDTSCPGWNYSDFDAFRYLSAVCPANRAWKRFEKVRDRAIGRGMKIGDPIPSSLRDEMLIAALYLERSYGALKEFRTKDSRINRLAQAVAEQDYQDSSALTRVAQGGRWQEPALAQGGDEPANSIRRSFNLPPVGPGSCPV